MPVLTRNGKTVTVPADVVEDYQAQGWLLPSEAAHLQPDITWTVEQLRHYARAKGIAYKGVRKPELLAALT